MASELIGGLKAKRGHELVFKIDFEKNFDTVEWSFLFHLMEQMNLSH